MFYAGIKGFYWTHVSAFLNIFNQFWCCYNTALFDSVTLLIFLVFYWRYKKNNWLWFHIANKKLWSKKFTLHEATSCLSSQNLTCPTPLQFVAISPVKISKGCCHFVPYCYIHDIYMYFLVLKSIKCRVTLFSKIKFQSVWVLRYDWWAFCLFKVSVMRRGVPKLPRTFTLYM